MESLLTLLVAYPSGASVIKPREQNWLGMGAQQRLFSVGDWVVRKVCHFRTPLQYLCMFCSCSVLWTFIDSFIRIAPQPNLCSHWDGNGFGNARF